GVIHVCQRWDKELTRQGLPSDRDMQNPGNSTNLSLCRRSSRELGVMSHDPLLHEVKKHRRFSGDVIAFNELHLKRLLQEYVAYYLGERTHLGLSKGTPNGRIRSASSGRVMAIPRLGGLHHRYERAA